MKQLRIILQSKLFWVSIILFTITYVVISVHFVNYKSIYNGKEKEFTGEIIKIQESVYGYSLTIKSREKLIAYTSNCNYQLGDIVLIKGSLLLPKNNTIFNAFNYKEYLYQKKIFYVINVDKIILLKENNNILYKIKNNLYKHINNFKSKNYLKTFLFADTSYLGNDIYNSYQINGISHLLSIGSMHITLLSYMILKILKKLRINFMISNIILFIIIYLYIILTDYPIAIIRIFIYLILSFVNKNLKLNLDSLKIFLLTIIITVFINPFLIYNKGFLYSYCISFILIINKNNLTGNYLIKLLKISIISFIYSIPFNIYFNYSINILSIFYNIIYVPIFNIIVFPMSFLTLLLPFLDNIYFFILNLINNLSNYLNTLTFGIIILKKLNMFFLIMYLIIFIFIIKNILDKKLIYFLFLIIILFCHYNINDVIKDNYFVIIDVSQGDSSLFYSNNKCILIDTGGIYNKQVSENTIMMLKSFGIKKIDILFLTHGDYDHMGDCIYFVNNFKVDEIIFNSNEFNKLEKELIKVLNSKNIRYSVGYQDLEYKLNNLNIKLLNHSYSNENDSSLVLYINFLNKKIMMMGDASNNTEKEIINEYTLPNIDILKVGHHGSKTSSSIEFINVINPKYSIISAGKNNRYGHPNKEVLDNLKKSKIYRTDMDGSILFKIIKNELKIETCSP